MTLKQISLTIPENLFKASKEYSKEFGYRNIQEFILELIRKKVFFEKIERYQKIEREMIEGKKVKTELWILTSFHTLEMARRTGLLEIIETAGGQIVPDTCVDQPCWRHLEGKVGATDSPKCAYYCNIRNMNFIVRSLRECIEGAVRGEVR